MVAGAIGLLAGAVAALQIGGGYPPSRLLRPVEGPLTRPGPRTPRPPESRPDRLWVPDRYVRVPGVPEGLHVPGHWAQRLPDGRYLVPPLVGCRPGTGQCQVIPGGVRGPKELGRDP